MQTLSSNRDLRLIRLYYFLWLGAGGFLSPFVTLFYNARGLDGTQIGLLATFGAITSMLTAPLWGRLGDRSPRPRRLIMIALIASAFLALGRGLQSLFWFMAIFIVLDALMLSGSGSLSVVQALAVTEGGSAGFGSVRLWGSLGWAAVTPLAGVLIERLGLYVPFAGYAALLLAAVVVLSRVRIAVQPKTHAEGSKRPPIRTLLGSLSQNRKMVGVALAFTVLWIATNGRAQFETLYMNQLGARASLIGIANTVSALFEVPFMLLADRLIRRSGSWRILHISLLVQAASFLPVVFLPSIPSFFFLRITASIALSLNVPAYFNYLVENAPEGQGGTAVSLFDVTLRGGVGLLAAPLAGFLFDLIGAYWLYVFGLVGCLLAWLILQAVTHPVRPSQL